MTALEWSVCERTDWLLNLGLRSAPTSHIPRVIRRQTHFVTHFIPGCKHSCVIPFNGLWCFDCVLNLQFTLQASI